MLKKSKEMFVKFSIILPVYNVSAYIREAIKSVLNQTYSDFELIIVNDGSNDGSDIIANEIAKVDDRIIIVNQKNMGLSKARNSGIQSASGEYIIFMDSDDVLNSIMLSTIDKEIIEEHAETLMIGYQYFNEDKYFAGKTIATGVYNSKEILHFILNRKLENYVWQFAIKKSLISNQLFFKNGVFFEDIDWTPRLLTYVNNIHYINLPLYLYRNRRNSITHSLNQKKLIDLDLVLNSMLETVNNNFPNEVKNFMIWRKPLDLTIYFNYSLLGWKSENEKNILRKKIRSYNNEGLTTKQKLKKYLISFMIIDFFTKFRLINKK